MITLDEQKKMYAEKKHTGLTFLTATVSDGTNWTACVLIQNWLNGELMGEIQKDGKIAWGNEEAALLEADGIAVDLQRDGAAKAKELGFGSTTIQREF